MELNLFSLQRTLQDYGVMISFSGRFTQAIIEELGDAVKKYLETETVPQTATYNAFSVFIEQTQNIKNYGAQDREELLRVRIANSGIVAIGKSTGGYFVSSGNIIENKDVGALMEKLERVASLDKTGLKRLYKEQMKKEVPPDSAGAGIGFIDMARRAVGPLQHSIVQLDETVSFFTLKVHV